MRPIVLVLLALAACSGPRAEEPVANNQPQAEEHATPSADASPVTLPPPLPDDGRRLPVYPGEFVAENYLGHWVGVEGMMLDVARTAKDGKFRLTMKWDLDHKGTFIGYGVGEPAAPGIAFTRSGEQLVLRQSDGNATGLKYLAGKYDCLMVKSGEGYCRD